MNLYKKDTKGKVRILKVYTEGAELIQESGLIDGTLITHRKTCKAKNVGKSNESTPENQAISEMESKIAEKLTEGYFKTLEELENSNVILPMLAKDYKEEKDKIKSFIYVQPKLDGMRCLAFIKNGQVTLMSRTGKPIETVPHIVEGLQQVKFDVILDGELYAHGYSFQENMELIKKFRPGKTDKLIKYHVYDVVEDGPYWMRNSRSILAVRDIPIVELVYTQKILNNGDLQVYHKKFLLDGYEGTIIRHGDEGYKVNGRSSNLLKYKDFIDIAATITDIEPAEQRPTWGVPVLQYEGKTFRAGAKMTHERREEMLLNKKDYIGKTAEIRFFEYSDEGIPRFPIMVGVRLDK